MFKKKKQNMQQDIILGCAALALMALLIAANLIDEAVERHRSA